MTNQDETPLLARQIVISEDGRERFAGYALADIFVLDLGDFFGVEGLYDLYEQLAFLETRRELIDKRGRRVRFDPLSEKERAELSDHLYRSAS